MTHERMDDVSVFKPKEVAGTWTEQFVMKQRRRKHEDEDARVQRIGGARRQNEEGVHA